MFNNFRAMKEILRLKALKVLFFPSQVQIHLKLGNYLVCTYM